MINSSTASFIINTAVVFVPLFEAIRNEKFPREDDRRITDHISRRRFVTPGGRFHRFLAPANGSVCLRPFSGTISIILTGLFSRKTDPMCMGIMQVGMIALLSLGASYLSEISSGPQTAAHGPLC